MQRQPIHVASEKGKADEVDRLMYKKGVHANMKDSSYRDFTPLHYAAMKGHAELAWRLLNKHNADVNAKATGLFYGLAPVHIAALYNHWSVVDMLLKASIAAGTDINAKVDVFDLRKAPLLILAAYKGSSETVQTLIDYGADIHVTTADWGHSCKNLDGANALHAAAYCAMNKPERYISVCSILIKNGIDLNSRNKHGKTPEQVARESDESLSNQVAEYLGPSLPLHSAARDRDIREMKRLVLGESVDVNERNHFGLTALHYAAIFGNSKSCTSLVNELQADVHAPIRTLDYVVNSGQTPLHVAAKEGHNATCEVLIKQCGAGDDVNAKADGPGIKGGTPLHFAVKFKGDSSTVKLLAAHEADVNATTDEQGNADELDNATPILFAILYKEKTVRTALINAGANYLYVTDSGGKTLLHLAALHGNKDLCAMLIKRGASVCAKAKDGKTPLHFAAMQRNKGLCVLLIRHGADVSIEDFDGKTPHMLAYKATTDEDFKVAEYLEQQASLASRKSRRPRSQLRSSTTTERDKGVRLLGSTTSANRHSPRTDQAGFQESNASQESQEQSRQEQQKRQQQPLRNGYPALDDEEETQQEAREKQQAELPVAYVTPTISSSEQQQQQQQQQEQQQQHSAHASEQLAGYETRHQRQGRQTSAFSLFHHLLAWFKKS